MMVVVPNYTTRFILFAVVLGLTVIADIFTSWQAATLFMLLNTIVEE